MLGVVLAGGQGRRMGRDKAWVAVGGEPLWRRQASMLRRSGAERVVVARRAGQAPIDACVVFDLYSNAGPLAGLHAALRRGGAPFLAVVAVDMPGVGPPWFHRLLGFCRPGVGAVFRHAASLEPLAAIYPAEALAWAEERLRRRDLSVRRFASELAACGRMVVATLPASEARLAESLNAPPA